MLNAEELPDIDRERGAHATQANSQANRAVRTVQSVKVTDRRSRFTVNRQWKARGVALLSVHHPDLASIRETPVSPTYCE